MRLSWAQTRHGHERTGHDMGGLGTNELGTVGLHKNTHTNKILVAMMILKLFIPT